LWTEVTKQNSHTESGLITLYTGDAELAVKTANLYDIEQMDHEM